MKHNKFIKKVFIWGFLLWLAGYVLGIVLFPIIPASMIGWVIMPIGIFITLWVLRKKIKLESFNQYIILAVIWTAIAVVFDYLFLVKVFMPEDGYYKLDVYLYYFLTFFIPLLIGYRKTGRI